MVFASDLAGSPDEAGHLTTGVMFYDYARAAIGQDPVAFAKAYYARYPKVAIGHWPPFFYALQAGWYSLVGPSVATARWLCGLIALALAVTILLAAKQLHGWPGAVCAAALFGSLPVVVGETWLVVSDTLLALCMVGACLAFTRAMTSPTRGAAFVFAVCAVAAVLTKATGWTLGLFMWVAPALAGHASTYRRLWFWLSGLSILAAGAPFYLLAHRAGIGYSNVPEDLAGRAAEALSGAGRTVTLLSAIPWPVLALSCAGLVLAWLSRRLDGGRHWRAAATASAILAGQFPVQFFLNLTPEPRYYLPSAAVLMLCAAGGFAAVIRVLGARWPLAGAIPALVLAGSAAKVTPGPNGQMFSGYDQACRLIPYAPSGSSVLVASDPYGEGAVVISRLLGDVDRRGAVLRGSKTLANSTWNNQHYRLLVQTPDDLAALMTDQPIHFVVLDGGAARMPHLTLLEQFLGAHPAAFRLVGVVPVVHRGHDTRAVSVFEHIGASGIPLGPIRVWLGPDRGWVESASK